jgi:osmotically inducible protein OsmC
MKRKATAVWNGSGKEGKGTLTTQSTALQNMQYSFLSRFESGVGTNPEELIAAAHAGCLAMKLSFVLGAAGFTPDSIEATSTVTLEDGAIKSSNVEMKAKVPGISADQFKAAVDETKANCIVSKALSVEINLDAKLI